MHRTITLLRFVLVTLTWGTTWMAMSIASTTISPIFATGIRFTLAAPLLILLAVLCRVPLLYPIELRWYQAFVSLFYFAIPFSLMIYGEQYVSSGLAALIFSTMPALVLLLSVFMLHEKLRAAKLAGLVISTTALAAILLIELDWSQSNSLTGIAALLCAALLHAYVYTRSKKQCHSLSVLTFSALPSAFAGVMLLVFGWLFERPSIEHFSMMSLAATAYLGFVAGVFGILNYFALQQRTTAFRASLAFVIFPVIAIWVEDICTDKSLSRLSYAFLAQLIVGILLVVYPGKRGKNVNSTLASTADAATVEHEGA
ncbi:DMT family transporter [Paraburkholderia sp. Tr-20389]|uniref:DMT family transporter n=1 Tax=Paraburkholderia sp. Tr-20389 TaxID=2703903 RepID=UPI00197E8604|nr:DMT family transporter [Paraburkholderia sp. Tr-20389]MBN3758185.1 DMT family transporter [Paraburkholderia sp. Tr-20389]